MYRSRWLVGLQTIPLKYRPALQQRKQPKPMVSICIYSAFLYQFLSFAGHDKIKLVTDSEFVVNSMTQWIHKWKQNDWKVASGGEVKNKNDFMKLDQTLGTMQDVQWVSCLLNIPVLN